MTREKKMEDISMSYLSTMAASCGIDFERIIHDGDSMDCLLKKQMNRKSGGEFRAELGIQLKSTITDYSEDDEVIKYPLKVKNYNDLCRPASKPIFLGLLILPDDIPEMDWVKAEMDKLITYGRMYYLDLTGKKKSDNQATVTVSINKSKRLTPESLEDILQKLADDDL